MQIRGGNEIYNNTKFGTKVLLRPETKELIEKSNAKEQIYQQITNLKNNNVNDYLILSHSKTKNNEPYINAEIVEIIDNVCFINARTYSSFLEEKQDETTTNHIDIGYLYNASKEKMIKTGITTKQLFKTFIHEYQEM